MARLNERSCRSGAPLKQMFTADEAFVIKRFLNSFDVRMGGFREPFVDRSSPVGEYVIYLPRTSGTGGVSFPWDKLAFGYALSAELDSSDEPTGNTICTINPGKIRIHGAGVFELTSAASVVLTPMTTAWVYAQMPRAGGSITVLATSTEPESNATSLKVPLYKFTKSGESYVLSDGDGIRHMGDINLDVPLL